MDTHPFPPFRFDPDALRGRRILLVGPPGSGKSTFAAQLGARLASVRAPVCAVAADPGSPAFGLPGALALGRWSEAGWQTVALEPLCSLDAGRFRLPLVEAARRLLVRADGATLLLDTPGTVRGTAGAELIGALAALADMVVVLYRERPPLPDELRALAVPVHWQAVAPEAKRLSDAARARSRTALWDAYLAESAVHRLPWGQPCIGTPPPANATDAWVGRQVALLGPEPVLGEVVAADLDGLAVRLPNMPAVVEGLLVRDAQRGAGGMLGTAERFGTGVVGFLATPSAAAPAPAAAGPVPVARIGPGTAVLVNGVFGDPLLHFRFTHRRRSLLFDLGDAGRLPARIAHQVSDVFVSHTHLDHFSGFLWLLRSRIGETGICRLYGPPGLAANAAGVLAGAHWDRIGARGPRFEVAELHGDRLRRFALQAGLGSPRELGEAAVVDGVVHVEPAFRVRAVTLDHGIPVLAYCLEPPMTVHVRKERLTEFGAVPGPWLSRLRDAVLAGDGERIIELSDGRTMAAGELARVLLLAAPGERLAYATDFADTADNRARLAALAKGAHTLFCEASFLAADAAQAARTGHLTATACGAIGREAGVRFLVPFHFSRRYEEDPRPVYEEVRAACAQTLMPRGPV